MEEVLEETLEEKVLRNGWQVTVAEFVEVAEEACEKFASVWTGGVDALNAAEDVFRSHGIDVDSDLDIRLAAAQYMLARTIVSKTHDYRK